MSLTSQLRDPTSPMGSFMLEAFGYGTDWADHYHSTLQSARTLRPRVSGGYRCDYSLIGTALTYLFAWEMEPQRKWTLGELTVPHNGFYIWRNLAFNEDLQTYRYWPPESSSRQPKNTENGLSLLEELNAATAHLHTLSPEEKCRLALFLGMLDHWFRSGPKANERMYPIAPTDDLNKITRHLRPEWIEDVMNLRTQFLGSLPSGPTGKNIYLPCFAGSKDVGGADADWITGQTLIDCKATINPMMNASELRPHIWQLLGYAGLDWDNEFDLRDLGLYMARQGTWVIWNGDDLCGQASGGAVNSLEELRELTEEVLTGPQYDLDY